MIADKALAIQMKDLLTVCLAKAIDSALCNKEGERWFMVFVDNDAREKYPIFQSFHRTVYDGDLQALLKFLRYRPSYAETVLTYHGFITAEDTAANRLKKEQLDHLITRLITDYRNRLEAHTSAAYIEDTPTGVYTYVDAVEDMIKCAEVFAAVRDKDGVPYHERMTALLTKHTEQKDIKHYAVDEVFESLPTRPSTDEFLECCRALEIPVLTVNGTLHIATATFATDVARICSHLVIKKEKRKRKRSVLALITVAVILLIVMAATVFCFQTLFKENRYICHETPAVVADQVTPFITRMYWDGDELVCDCVITNGLSRPLDSIRVNKLSVSNDIGLIAGASFGDIVFDEPLAAGDGASHTFRFKSNCVLLKNADLTDSDSLAVNCHIPLTVKKVSCTAETSYDLTQKFLKACRTCDYGAAVACYLDIHSSWESFDFTFLPASIAQASPYINIFPLDENNELVLLTLMDGDAPQPAEYHAFQTVRTKNGWFIIEEFDADINAYAYLNEVLCQKYPQYHQAFSNGRPLFFSSSVLYQDYLLLATDDFIPTAFVDAYCFWAEENGDMTICFLTYNGYEDPLTFDNITLSMTLPSYAEEADTTIWSGAIEEPFDIEPYSCDLRFVTIPAEQLAMDTALLIEQDLFPNCTIQHSDPF